MPGLQAVVELSTARTRSQPSPDDRVRIALVAHRTAELKSQLCNKARLPRRNWL